MSYTDLVEIPAGYLQARYVWALSGSTREMVNVCGHLWDAPTVPDPNDVASDLRIRWVAALAAQQRSVYTFVRVDVQLSAGSFPLLGTSASGTLGAVTTDPAAPNTAVLVRKRTAAGGRANRGRMYVPGMVAENNISQTGVITSAQLTILQSTFTDWLNRNAAGTGGTGTPYPFVVLHDAASPVDTPTPVTSFQVDSLVGTQRRRLR